MTSWIQILIANPDPDPGTPLNPYPDPQHWLPVFFLDCVNAFDNLRSTCSFSVWTGDMLGNLLCLLTLGPDVLIRVVAGEGEGSLDFLVTVSGADKSQ